MLSHPSVVHVIYFYALGAPRAQRGHIGFTLSCVVVVVCRRLLSLYLFFSKSLPLLFQSVGWEANKNSQWKFWNFLTIFKDFRPKNWKIVKNFKIELVPQFCLDPKDTWGLVRYRFWPKNVGIRILIFVPVFLKNGFKNMRFSAFRVHGCIFSVAHDQTLIFHLEFISGIRFLKNPFLALLRGSPRVAVMFPGARPFCRVTVWPCDRLTGCPNFFKLELLLQFLS